MNTIILYNGVLMPYSQAILLAKLIELSTR